MQENDQNIGKQKQEIISRNVPIRKNDHKNKIVDGFPTVLSDFQLEALRTLFNEKNSKRTACIEVVIYDF